MVLSAALSLTAIREDARKIFLAFDVNRNGFLRVGELQSLIGEIFPDAVWDIALWPSMCAQLGADPDSDGLTLEQYLKMHTALVAGGKTAAWGLRSTSKIVRAAALYAEVASSQQQAQPGAAAALDESQQWMQDQWLRQLDHAESSSESNTDAAPVPKPAASKMPLNLKAIREDATRIFQNVDVNSNGFLCFDELQVLVGQIFPDGQWDSAMWPSILLKKLGADPDSDGLTLEQYLKMHTALVAGGKTAAWGLRSTSKIVRAAALYAEVASSQQQAQPSDPAAVVEQLALNPAVTLVSGACIILLPRNKRCCCAFRCLSSPTLSRCLCRIGGWTRWTKLNLLPVRVLTTRRTGRWPTLSYRIERSTSRHWPD